MNNIKRSDKKVSLALGLLATVIGTFFLIYVNNVESSFSVSDQELFLVQARYPILTVFEVVGPRYWAFIMYLKFIGLFFAGEQNLIIGYCIFNGLLLAIGLRYHSLPVGIFLIVAYIYLAHGLLRDQLILVLSSLITGAGKRNIVLMFLVLSLRLQLAFSIAFKRKLMDFIFPSSLFMGWLLFLVAFDHRTYDLRDPFEIINWMLLSLFSIPGLGYLHINFGFPTVFEIIRVFMGFFFIIFLISYLFRLFRDGTFFLVVFCWKYLLFMTFYSLIGIEIDIRVHITFLAICVINSQFVNTSSKCHASP